MCDDARHGRSIASPDTPASNLLVLGPAQSPLMRQFFAVASVICVRLLNVP